MTWRIFYSYASEDTELVDRLSKFLKPLQNNNKIDEWHNRMILPGAVWESEINAHLESAHLILFMVSADFLASEYCFSVEVEKALDRLKKGEVKILPVLLKPCLWRESRFSELQIIPRNAHAITSWKSVEEAFNNVAEEIQKLVSDQPPESIIPVTGQSATYRFDTSLNLVHSQIRSYAHLYERTRQRMSPSGERTQRMTQIFQKMKILATASYPLLEELAGSPSPGERLAAIAILQVFASEKHLDFLVNTVGSEKPFVGYHAIQAIHFAVESLDPHFYPQLMKAIKKSQVNLNTAQVGFDTDRQTVLRSAEQDLYKAMQLLGISITQ